MLENKTKKLIREYLTRQTYADDPDRGPVKKVVIHQVTTTGKRGMEIGQVELADKPDTESITGYIADIEAMVTGDVEGSGTMQRYVLVAHHKGENGWDSGAKLTIRVAPENDDDGDTMSEGPTKTGILAQQMRHTEVFARIAVSTADRSIVTLQKQNEKLQEQVEKLLDKNFDLVTLIEELQSKKLERELATEESRAKLANRQELVNKMLMLAPILVNKIAVGKNGGQKLLPEKTTDIEQMVHSFMVSIKPDQFEALVNALGPDQKMTLMTIYQAVSKFDPSGDKKNGAAS